MAILEDNSAQPNSSRGRGARRSKANKAQPMSIMGLIFGSGEESYFSGDDSYSSDSYEEESATNYSTISGSSEEDDMSDTERSESKNAPTTRAGREQLRFDRDLRARHRSACKHMTVSVNISRRFLPLETLLSPCKYTQPSHSFSSLSMFCILNMYIRMENTPRPSRCLRVSYRICWIATVK